MSELPLDHNQRNALVRHLDRVRVPQLMLVPTSAQASLCRPGRYADGGREVGAEEGLCVAGSAYSEVLEELQERVGGSIAAGFGVEGFGPVDRLLLVGHVGV